MTQVEKKKQLARLDEQVLDLLILNTSKAGDTSILTELSVAVNYLKSNAIVAEKEKSTLEKETKARLDEAKKRRKNNESE
ncbi:MAG: hypothetical protein J7L77_05285 [Clostridiales bacterium]|nr:hypothetical protein [Clostridiales bacterium]